MRAAALAAGAVIAAAVVAAPATAAPATAAPAQAALPAADANAGRCEAGTYLWVADKPAAFSTLQTDLTWPITQGGGVTVAVVDSGVDAGSEHLADAMAGGVDLVGDGQGANGLADPFGHGTVIAGVIAARPLTDHPSGLEGLAPQAKILSVRVYASDSEEAQKAGFGPSPERLAAGIRYAAEHGAQVINVSLSTTADDPGVRSAVAEAQAMGSLVVASSGNRTTADNTRDGVRYPAGYPGVLGVAALDGDGVVTDDSIHGPQTSLTAPGAKVLSVQTGGGDCYFPSDGTSPSYATAYVSAAAALVAAAHPDETPAQWAYRLEASAVRADPDRRDDVNGWGMVQPYAAIALSPGPGIRGPSSPFADTSGSKPVIRSGTVTPDHSAPAFALTTATAVLIGVVGATLLGTVGVLAVLLRRRRDAAQDARG